MKQSIRGLLALLLAILLLGGAAALAECVTPTGTYPTHDLVYGDNTATCTQPGTQSVYCSRCRAQSIVPTLALGHEWWYERLQEPTCTEPGVQQKGCVREYECGFIPVEEEIEPLGHAWGDWQVLKEATCSNAGLAKHVCSRCRKEEEKTIPKKEHSVKSWKTEREATCAKEGEQTGKCSLCGNTISQPLPRTAHTFGEWKIIERATPRSKGIRQRVCEVCGYAENEEFFPHGTMSRGEKNDKGAVKELQNALNEAGFNCGKADGDFGKKTEQAVKDLEGTIDMEPDGIAWPAVLQELDLFDSAAELTLTGSLDGLQGAPGDTLSVDFTVTNTGSTILTVNGYASRLENGDLAEEDYADEWDDTGDVLWSWLNPGQNLPFILNIAVNDQDAAAGEIRRLVSVQAGIWIDTDTGVPAQGDVSASSYSVDSETIESNIVEIVIPLGEPVTAKADPVRLVKEVLNQPANGMYFVEGETVEYGFTFANSTDYPMGDVEISDPMKGSNEDACVDRVPELGAGESFTPSFTHTVTAEEAAAGTLTNIASVMWTDTVGNELKSLDSNPVTVPTGVETVSTPVVFEKAVLSKPANGQYYVEGETVEYGFTFRNDGDHAITDVEIYDPMKISDEDDCVGRLPELGAGESFTPSFTHTVTAMEATAGTLVNVGSAVWFDPADSQHHDLGSNTVTVDAGIPSEPEGVVTIRKSVECYPANGFTFTEGEKVYYLVEVENGLDYDVANPALKDTLCGELITPDVIPAGTKYNFHYDYVVTKSDAEQGSIDNTAALFWSAPTGAPMAVQSNTVTVPTSVDAPTPAGGMTITKTVSNTPGNGKYYVVGETIAYELKVSNPSPQEFYDVLVIDKLSESGDPVIKEFDNFAAGWSTTVYFTYTVKPEDAVVGSVSNQASLKYIDSVGHVESADSEIVQSPVGFAGTTVDGLTITKSVVSMPANGMCYLVGETVEYEITVENNTDAVFHDVTVRDPLTNGENGIVIAFPSAEPGFHKTMTVKYEVTDIDAIAGIVTNIAFVTGVDEENMPHESVSEPVNVDTGRLFHIGNNRNPMPPVQIVPLPGLTVTKSVTSTPANGKYYTEGEVIYYSIVYENTGSMTLDHVTIYDSLQTENGGKIGESDHLEVGQTAICYFSHTVTADDVAKGSVKNVAFGQYVATGVAGTAMSNEVVSPTGEEKPPRKHRHEVDTPVTTPRESAGNPPCVRTLLRQNQDQLEYDLDYCDLHTETYEKADALVAAATTPDELLDAWIEARALWQADLDELYSALLLAADDDARVIILNERVQFAALTVCRKTLLYAQYPDQPEKAEQLLTEMLMNRVADLCYATHTAPSARTDSLTRVPVDSDSAASEALCDLEFAEKRVGYERYVEQFCDAHALTLHATHSLLENGDAAAIWNRVRQLWEVEMSAASNARYAALDEPAAQAFLGETDLFGNWLTAREELLELLYPDNPEIVSETVFQSIKNRTLRLCDPDFLN